MKWLAESLPEDCGHSEEQVVIFKHNLSFANTGMILRSLCISLKYRAKSHYKHRIETFKDLVILRLEAS